MNAYLIIGRTSKMVRVTFFLAFIFFQFHTLSGQTSLAKINLVKGEFDVGYQHYTAIDSTRKYQIKNEFNNQFVYRPIPISIWYPTKIDQESAKQLTVLNYLEILKEEEEWKNLPNYFLLDWFPYLWNTPQNNAHLTEKTTAFANSTMLEGSYPVIVYAASYQSSSIENFALFEYLTSHGFIVISSPSRGTGTRWLEGGITKDMETQSRDVEFLLKEIHNYKNIDSSTIALMGFSFGGISNAITVMKNHTVKALISLDGTERYNYPVLAESVFFDLNKIDIPYVHFAQKIIPEEVLVEDNIPGELNTKFQLYDSLKYSSIHSYRFNDLSHSYFSSFGVLFGNRDKRQDTSDAKIMNSYNLLSKHVLEYLKAFLKDDKTSLKFINNNPKKNGFSEFLISKKTKEPLAKTFDYKDFNDIALNQNYENLISLYKKLKGEHPELSLEEGMLNTLGLRLSFDSIRKEQGIQVLVLALHIYPKSANLYDSLAESYFYNKDFENAIFNFKKSLELNPQNQNAIDRLKQLKE